MTPLCLIIQTSPNNKAVASGNGNRMFTEKRHVQIANNPRSPQCQTRLNYYFLPDPAHFSPSTFKETCNEADFLGFLQKLVPWRVGESFFNYEYLREFEANIETASVARWQKFRPKSSKGAAEKKVGRKNLWPNFWLNFTKKWQKRGRRKFSKDVPYFYL